MLIWGDDDKIHPVKPIKAMREGLDSAPSLLLVGALVLLMAVGWWSRWKMPQTKPSKPVAAAVNAETTDWPVMSVGDRVANITEELLAERGVYVGWTAIRREKVRELRARYQRARRARDLTRAYQHWQATGRLGTDPVTLATRQVLAGDPSVDRCFWLYDTIPVR